MDIPKGIGVYLRDIRSMGDLKKDAETAKANGVNYVALLACWQEKGGITPINSPAEIKACANEFKAVGIATWIWGYPHNGGEDAFIAAMRKAEPEVCEGWILDPEKPYKFENKAGEALQRARAKKLVDLTLDSLSEKKGLGLTTYGMADYHKNFPWTEFCVGFGSPQLYEVSPAEVDAGIAAWRRRGFSTIIPSVPVYGSKSEANLDAFLKEFINGTEDVSGFIFWSWPQISKTEWKTIKKWSDWLAAKP